MKKITLGLSTRDRKADQVLQYYGYTACDSNHGQSATYSIPEDDTILIIINAIRRAA